ncbi:MAG: magnesium transporter [Firmicutes bacterium]|nr:magnesium transporter [Bacillota bacterium]
MDKNLLLNRDEAFEESMGKIYQWFEEKMYFKIKDEFLKYNEADIAEMFEEFLAYDDLLTRAIVVYRLLPKSVMVDVFAYLPSDDQLKIVERITDAELNYIIGEMDFDDKIDILEELPATLVNRILENTPKTERKLINTFLNYPDDCAGSIMTPDFISLQKEWTVKEAMAHIKEVGMDTETIYTCYVKDGAYKLVGIVSLRTLVIAPDEERIMNLMHTDFVCVQVDDDQEEVSEAFKKYGFIAMPVVDKEGRLVGIITVDDILDVIEEENTEDIERMAGIIDMEQSDEDYLDKSVWKHARNRLPWLLFMMFSAMVTGAVLNAFEEQLSTVIVLVSYIPLLMGTGGNTGAQASTLMIRGLSLGEIEPCLEDAGKILWKELRISLCVGAVLSTVNFLKILIIDQQSPLVALTVCLSLILVIMFAKMLGGMVPLAAEKLGLDPALMANPIIASLVDLASMLVYLCIAMVILGI